MKFSTVKSPSNWERTRSAPPAAAAKKARNRCRRPCWPKTAPWPIPRPPPGSNGCGNCDLKLAKEAEVPPYVVFHDKTLAAMAALRPRDETELMAISGVGEAKLERWGAAFLAALAEEPGTWTRSCPTG